MVSVFNLVPAATVLPNPEYGQPPRKIEEGLAVNFDTWDNQRRGSPGGGDQMGLDKSSPQHPFQASQSLRASPIPPQRRVTS